MAIDSVSKFFGRNKAEEASDQVLSLDLNLLQVNPYQPRKQFDPIQLEELSRSIAELGIIQPIVVRQSGDKYEIVAGERRFRASRMAGLTAIPAVVRNFTDREMAEIALVENLQRADLNYFEEAEGYRKLIEEFHLTQEDVAARVGKSQPTIANKLRILKIDPIVKENIMVELLTERHVRALLKLRSPEEQLLILKEIYEKELNVKDSEYLITEFLEGRIVISEGEETQEDGEADTVQKQQRIRRIFADMRIYVNTIKAAVTTIEESGIDVKMDQTETDDFIQLTITIPRAKK
ncbi:MAG: ParB/RepB/Spo0J family partition protein [Clostridiales bacterium]